MPNFLNQPNPLLDSITNPIDPHPSDPISIELNQNAVNDATPKQLQSKAWRLSNLYFVVDKHGNKVIFKPNSAQVHFLQNRSFFNIILKSRQLGFTTLAAVDMLDNVLFRSNFHALLISYDEDSAKDLFQKKVQFAWENLNPSLQSKYKVDSSRSNMLRLDHGEANYSSFKVDNSGRSATYNQVHISEFAKICKNYPEKVDDIIRGTFPSVHPPFGQITIESTSEGPSGDFYEMYTTAASLPENHIYRPKEFKAFFYNWQWDTLSINTMVKEPDPNIPKEFKDIQTKHNLLSLQFPKSFKHLTDKELTYWYYLWLSDCKKSWKKLFLEYPLTPEDAFKNNSSILFDLTKLQTLKAKAQELPPPQEEGLWLFYKPIDPSHEYILAGDPSEGTGGDHSAATLVDFSPTIPEVIATFADKNTPPDVFAHELAQMGNKANTALIMVERNNHGHTTLTTLKGIYPLDFIYKEEVKSKEDDEITEKLGWHTNLATKPRMFYDLSTAINSDLISIPSLIILSEAQSFDRSQLLKIKLKDSNETTKHFDLLTSLAIAYQGRHLLANLSQEVTVTFQTSNTDPNADF